MSKILIINAGKEQSAALKRILAETVQTKAFVSMDGALSYLPTEAPDCLLLCLKENDPLPVEWISQVRQYDDHLPVLVITPPRPVDDAVALMKAGAFDYFKEPIEEEKIKIAVAHACSMYQLTQRVFLLENQSQQQTSLDDLVGSTPRMQEVFQTIRLVAKSNATVLILGESGTGKELVARAVHRHSPRVGRKFIDINCGAIPRELLENELFGHERGAFTGADRRYQGCCERADGGTLFLDEISEMEPLLQVKLLRFLQERQFTRIGGTESIQVDVRIIAATNRDLGELARTGKFREDLYYRLNVVPVALPPLRERAEDVPLLAKHFLEVFSNKNEKIFLDFSQEALEALMAHPWPGNVRELENTIERVVVLHNDTRVKVAHLPEVMRKKEGASEIPKIPAALRQEGGTVVPLEVMERYLIESALKACTGNVSEAARRLKIGQATMYRKIKQYGLRS